MQTINSQPLIRGTIPVVVGFLSTEPVIRALRCRTRRSRFGLEVLPLVA